MGGLFSGIASAIGDVTSSLGNIISPISGLVSGGLSLLGTNQTNQANSAIAAAANQQSLANQIQAEQYNTQMSNTTYQRTVADLKAAGLNPMLAYGNTNSSPTTGIAPVVQAAPRQSALGNAVQSAFNSASQAQTISNQQATKDLTYQQVDTSRADMLDTLAHIPVNDANRDLIRKQYDLVAQQTRESITRSALNTAYAANAAAEHPYYESKGQSYKDYSYSFDRGSQMFGQVAGGVGNLVSTGARAASMLGGKSPTYYQPTINNNYPVQQ
jgi:hypothetical protein